MKEIIDFVSNSSSSSFICLAEDAKTIDLFNTSETMNLHEYLQRFGCIDVFSSWYDRVIDKMRFVDDEEFCRNFKNSVHGMLPNSAIDAFYDAKKDYDTFQWSAAEYIWQRIMPVVENVLSPVWGQHMFEYYEAEDNTTYSEEHSALDYGSWEDNEESHLIKVFSSRTMEFSRVFNNH